MSCSSQEIVHTSGTGLLEAKGLVGRAMHIHSGTPIISLWDVKAERRGV